MPTLFARRYFRPPGQIGLIEKLLGLLILLLVVGTVAAFVIHVTGHKGQLFSADATVYETATSAVEPVAEAASDQAPNPFPDPGLDSWQAPSQYATYTPDNLYVKINGRADAYLQFGVVTLTFGTYRHQTDSEQTIDVYWYDMGQPQNALGIYRSEAPPELHAVPIGREGYEAGGAVFFHKGGSYVQVLPMSFDEGVAQAARAIAERLAEQIDEGQEDDWAQAVLPQAGRMADSFAYLARDAFSLDFLTDVYTAEYEIDGRRLTLFVHRAPDESAVRSLLERYVGFFEKYGRVIAKEPEESPRIIAGDVAGMIDVVFAKGRYLGGVAGADDVESARKAAMAFYDELTTP